MRLLKLVAFATLLVSFALVARPAMAESANDCVTDPSSGPVGTNFYIACGGFTPGVTVSVYAVEPDGRASGSGYYGFLPTLVRASQGGVAAFTFYTEFPGFSSLPPGPYTIVVQETGLGKSIIHEDHVSVTVQSRAITLSGATLNVALNDRVATFNGGGFAPFEPVNIWVTQPGGANCSGFGIDELTLAALAGDGATIWDGPGTVKATASGQIGFTIIFNERACIGEYHVTARALGSGNGAEVAFVINGNSVTASGGAWITVSPSSVPAYRSSFVVTGYGFPSYTTVNCWFTRPDGRVLDFLNLNAKTDAGGSFAANGKLDDTPPFAGAEPVTATDPGTWYATCATPSHAYLATTWFTVYGLTSDP